MSSPSPSASADVGEATWEKDGIVEIYRRDQQQQGGGKKSTENTRRSYESDHAATSSTTASASSPQSHRPTSSLHKRRSSTSTASLMEIDSGDDYIPLATHVASTSSAIARPASAVSSSSSSSPLNSSTGYRPPGLRYDNPLFVRSRGPQHSSSSILPPAAYHTSSDHDKSVELRKSKVSVLNAVPSVPHVTAPPVTKPKETAKGFMSLIADQQVQNREIEANSVRDDTGVLRVYAAAADHELKDVTDLGNAYATLHHPPVHTTPTTHKAEQRERARKRSFPPNGTNHHRQHGHKHSHHSHHNPSHNSRPNTADAMPHSDTTHKHKKQKVSPSISDSSSDVPRDDSSPSTSPSRSISFTPPSTFTGPTHVLVPSRPLPTSTSGQSQPSQTSPVVRSIVPQTQLLQPTAIPVSTTATTPVANSRSPLTNVLQVPSPTMSTSPSPTLPLSSLSSPLLKSTPSSPRRIPLISMTTVKSEPLTVKSEPADDVVVKCESNPPAPVTRSSSWFEDVEDDDDCVILSVSHSQADADAFASQQRANAEQKDGEDEEEDEDEEDEDGEDEDHDDGDESDRANASPTGAKPPREILQVDDDDDDDGVPDAVPVLFIKESEPIQQSNSGPATTSVTPITDAAINTNIELGVVGSDEKASESVAKSSMQDISSSITAASSIHPPASILPPLPSISASSLPGTAPSLAPTQAPASVGRPRPSAPVWRDPRLNRLTLTPFCPLLSQHDESIQRPNERCGPLKTKKTIAITPLGMLKLRQKEIFDELLEADHLLQRADEQPPGPALDEYYAKIERRTDALNMEDDRIDEELEERQKLEKKWKTLKRSFKQWQRQNDEEVVDEAQPRVENNNAAAENEDKTTTEASALPMDVDLIDGEDIGDDVAAGNDDDDDGEDDEYEDDDEDDEYDDDSGDEAAEEVNDPTELTGTGTVGDVSPSSSSNQPTAPPSSLDFQGYRHLQTKMEKLEAEWTARASTKHRSTAQQGLPSFGDSIEDTMPPLTSIRSATPTTALTGTTPVLATIANVDARVVATVTTATMATSAIGTTSTPSISSSAAVVHAPPVRRRIAPIAATSTPTTQGPTAPALASVASSASTLKDVRSHAPLPIQPIPLASIPPHPVVSSTSKLHPHHVSPSSRPLLSSATAPFRPLNDPSMPPLIRVTPTTTNLRTSAHQPSSQTNRQNDPKAEIIDLCDED